MIAYIGIGIGLTSLRPFNPASLFGASDVGDVWVSIPSMMTVGRDGTGGVPGVGDPVGRHTGMRGHHKVAVSDAKRAVLRQKANGKYYLEYDGVDDSYTVSTLVGIFRNVGYGSLAVSVNFIGASIPTDRVLSASNNIAGGASGRLSLHAGINNNGPIGGRRLDADSFQSIAASAFTTGEKSIIAVAKWAEAKLFGYLNGVLYGSDDPFQTAGNTSDTDSAEVAFGATSGGTEPYQFYEFGALMINRALTNAEISSVNTWLTRLR